MAQVKSIRALARELHEAEADREVSTRYALNALGWKYTSGGMHSPYWMYEKEIDGKVYVTDQKTALNYELQRATDDDDDDANDYI